MTAFSSQIWLKTKSPSSCVPTQTSLSPHRRVADMLGLRHEIAPGQKPLVSQPPLLQRQHSSPCPAFPRRCPFGGACHTCPVRIQAKLIIGQPEDKYEQEADRMADMIMDPPMLGLQCQAKPEAEEKEQALQAKPVSSPITPWVQMQAKPEAEEEEEFLQAKPASGQLPAATPELAARIQSLRGSGQPLPTSVRSLFEPHFGHDFSRVQVHTDAQTAEAVRAVRARALTVEQDIAFRTGQYAPETGEGRQLLAHELTHVVQQTSCQVANQSGTTVLQRQEADEPASQPAAKIIDCSAKVRKQIMEGIRQAKSLASRALQALRRDMPLIYEFEAMHKHFGWPNREQEATVLSRYEDIQTTMDSKTFKCSPCEKKKKASPKHVTRLCGWGDCPGTKIVICPSFGMGGCPLGATVLHEAAHNAGACDDVEEGKGYPPKKSQNNAYSYENFATDVKKGILALPPLAPKKESIPSIPGD